MSLGRFTGEETGALGVKEATHGHTVSSDRPRTRALSVCFPRAASHLGPRLVPWAAGGRGTEREQREALPSPPLSLRRSGAQDTAATVDALAGSAQHFSTQTVFPEIPLNMQPGILLSALNIFQCP